MKYVAIILLFISYHANATTWAPAMPYTITYDNQDIKVQAIAYQPYASNPEGKTEVYKKNKLLYTIDKYFREDVFVSRDGMWFVTIKTSNTTGVTSNINFGQKIDYDIPVIKIFKNGKFYKDILLNTIIDTNRISSYGYLFNWGYSRSFNTNVVRDIMWDCEYCIEKYGKDLYACDTITDEYSIEDCIECKRRCDSLKLIKAEVFLTYNNSYLKNNIIHILTNGDNVIQIDFNNECVLSKHPFSSIIPDKYNFTPPCVSTMYDEITVPNKFDMPTLKSGIAFEDALADYLGYKSGSTNNEEELTLIFRKLAINTNGRCEELDFDIWDENEVKYKTFYNKQYRRAFIQKVYNWVMLQEYDTKLIPTRYDKYYFYDFVHMH